MEQRVVQPASGASTARSNSGVSQRRPSGPVAALSKRTPTIVPSPSPTNKTMDDAEDIHVPILADSQPPDSEPGSSRGSLYQSREQSQYVSIEAAMQDLSEQARSLAEMAKGQGQEMAVEVAATRFAAEISAALRLRRAVEQAAGQPVRPTLLVCCARTLRSAIVALLNAMRHLYETIRKPLLYYLIGCVAYGAMEGWSALDTVYFLTVTSTTVGYGDFCPVTVLGKLFTCVYALIGITVVLSALEPFVAFLKGDWREKILELFGCGAKVDTDDLSLTPDEVNRLIDYNRRYLLALLGPATVLLSGMALHYTYIRADPAAPDALSAWLAEWTAANFGSGAAAYLTALHIDFVGLVDSFYWAVITMTTIGYGDVTPATTMGKILATVYLPFAVIALADAVSDVQMIGLRRSIRETDFTKQVDECLLRDSVREDPMIPNEEPVLSEAEFLIDQLTANAIVDSAAVNAIRRQFRYITRNGDFVRDEERALSPRLVYEELRQRAAAGQELSAGATALDLDAQGHFKWRSFEEWQAGSWRLRVGSAGVAAVKDAVARKKSVVHGQGMKTMVGALAGRRMH